MGRCIDVSGIVRRPIWGRMGGLAYLERHPETGENIRLLCPEESGLLDFAASGNGKS